MEDIVDTKELTEQLRDVLDSVPEFPPCGYIPISSKTLACWVSTFSTDVRRPRIRFLEWKQRQICEEKCVGDDDGVDDG